MLKRFALPAALLYTLFLTVLSLITLGDIPQFGTDYDDKIYHIGAYMVLMLLWYYAFKNPDQKSTIFKIALGCVLFGIVIEAIQGKVNVNRVADLLDVVANVVGVFLGLFFILNRLRKQR